MLYYTPVGHGAVAQLGERLPCTEEVRGSSPLSSTKCLIFHLSACSFSLVHAPHRISIFICSQNLPRGLNQKPPESVLDNLNERDDTDSRWRECKTATEDG